MSADARRVIDTTLIVTREQTDEAKVKRYRAMLREGSTPPPLAVLPYA
jgi:hypothetical protein